jgi:hypothetical protein
VGDVRHPQQRSQYFVAIVLLGVRGKQTYVLSGPICSKPMSQSWQIYVPKHSRGTTRICLKSSARIWLTGCEFCKLS